jgi:hypothetical protein
MFSVQSKPLTFLPVFAQMLRGLVQNTQDQYESLLNAQTRPYVLDDQLVERLLKLYRSQQQDELLWKKQLDFWQDLTLTETQRREINNLAGQAERLTELNQKVLDLVESLAPHTMNKLLAKDGAELGLEFLGSSAHMSELQDQFKDTYEKMANLAQDYTKFRSSLSVMIRRLLAAMPRYAVEKCAKRLNVYEDGKFLAETSYEVLVLLDYCLFHYQPEGKSLVMKHLETHFTSLSEEEIAVYGVVKHAFFTVLRVEATLIEGGIAVYDLLKEEHTLLFDKSLFQTAEPGMLVVCHLIKQPHYVLTTGAAIPIPLTNQTTKEILNYLQKFSLSQKNDPSERTKLATEIFKTCIWNDVLLSVNL